MAGSLQAFVLVAIALGAAAAVAVFFTLPTIRSALTAVAVGFATVFLGLVPAMHKCDAGWPFAQWLIPAVCGGLCALFIHSRRAWLLIIAISVTTTVGLSMHYSELVHGEYIGHAERGEAEWHSRLTGLYRRTAR
jgi:ABC-type multidrug transport system permease subunit